MDFCLASLKRPLVALVLWAFVLCAGGFSFFALPLKEYPDLDDFTLQVSINYSGASLDLIEDAITIPIEDVLAETPGLHDIRSIVRENQSLTYLNIKGKKRVSEKALTFAREKIAQLKNMLPKGAGDIYLEKIQEHQKGLPFMILAVTSESYSIGDLSHIIYTHLRNPFRLIPGIGQVQVWNRPYVTEIALDMKKLKHYALSVRDVEQALRKMTRSLPVGHYQQRYPLKMDVSIGSIEDFKKIRIQTPLKKTILLGDLGRLTETTEARQFRGRFQGKPALMIALNAASDANQVQVSEKVLEKVKDLNHVFKRDLTITTLLDQGEDMRKNLSQTGFTCCEAFLCVSIIMMIFLGSWWWGIIPVITLPLSLASSFIVLYMLGYSLNSFTLLALILAMGLVVDDTIIMVEAFQRAKEDGVSAVNAGQMALKKMASPILFVTLIVGLCYVPLFMYDSGLSRLFKEFAVTLTVAVYASGVVSLTLSPFLCTLIKSEKRSSGWFDKSERAWILKCETPKYAFKGYLYGAVLVLTAFLCWYLPHAVVPEEDASYMGIYSPKNPNQTLDELEDLTKNNEALLQSISDQDQQFSFLGPWGSSSMVSLKPWAHRTHHVKKWHEKLVESLKNVTHQAFPWWGQSSLPGLDPAQSPGVIELAITTSESTPNLINVLNILMKRARQNPQVESVDHSLSKSVNEKKIHMDPYVLTRLGIDPSLVAYTLRVFMEYDAELWFRNREKQQTILLKGLMPETDLNALYIPTLSGKMTSLGTFTHISSSTTVPEIRRMNFQKTGVLTVTFKKKENLAHQAKLLLHDLKSFIPRAFYLQETGSLKAVKHSFQEILVLVFLSLITIYGLLVIQFNSLKAPLLVVATLPLAVFGALLALALRGDSLHIYTYLGFLSLLGLSAKQGILLIQALLYYHKQDMSMVQIIHLSLQERLRPIVMTTIAMMVGALPLLLSSGPGASAKASLGGVFFGGLSIGTILSLFLIPWFFEKLYSVKK